LVRYLDEYPWIAGVLLICGGIFVGMFGIRYFTKVLWGVVFLMALMLLLIVCAIFNLMNTTLWFFISLFVSIAGASALAWLATREFALNIAFFLLGGAGGFFVGIMIYSAILTIVGSGPAWAMIAVAVVFAIIGSVLALKNAKMIVIFSTALIGSYWFMKGLSAFIGGYPNEAEIYSALANDLSLEGYLTNMFWMYLAILIGSFCFCTWW